MNIKTARLTLIPVSGQYTKEIYKHFNEQIIKYMFPAVNKTEEDTSIVVGKFIDQREKGTDFVYAITLTDGGEFIGIAGLHGVKEDVPKLGIWTKAESHGNHYGREAIGGLIDLAKGMGIKKLIYPVDRRNTPSRKIPIYYGGKVIIPLKMVPTSDGRTLEEEIYEILI